MTRYHRLPHASLSEEMGHFLLDSNRSQIGQYTDYVLADGNDATVANHFATLSNTLAETAVLHFFLSDEPVSASIDLHAKAALAAANFFRIKLAPGRPCRFDWAGASREIAAPGSLSGHGEPSILRQGLVSGLISRSRAVVDLLANVPGHALRSPPEAPPSYFAVRAMALQNLCRQDGPHDDVPFRTLADWSPSRNRDARMMHAEDRVLLAIHDAAAGRLEPCLREALAAHRRFYDSDGRNMRSNVHGLVACGCLAMLALARDRGLSTPSRLDDPYLPREWLAAIA